MIRQMGRAGWMLVAAAWRRLLAIGHEHDYDGGRLAFCRVCGRYR